MLKNNNLKYSGGFGEWYGQLGGEASSLTDTFIDRIAHDSYQINITSIDAEHDRSIQEKYSSGRNIVRELA